MYIFTCTYRYMCYGQATCTYIHTCVYVYIHMHIHVFIYIHTYTGTCVMGKLEAGTIKKGESLIIVPNKIVVTVDEIFIDQGEGTIQLSEAGPGDNMKVPVYVYIYMYTYVHIYT